MNPQLLEALDAAPEDNGVWDVLADWLEERGDARAEFMRLTRDVEFPGPSLNEAQRKSIDVAFQKAKRAWKLPDKLQAGLVWRHGFVSRALVREKEAQVLKHPAMRFVQRLSFEGPLLVLPPRHQLRSLACEEIEHGGLLSLEHQPRLRQLMLLNSLGASPDLLLVEPPETLMVDDAWAPVLRRAGDWVRQVKTLRVVVTPPEPGRRQPPHGLDDLLALIPDCRIITGVSHQRYWRDWPRAHAVPTCAPLSLHALTPVLTGEASERIDDDGWRSHSSRQTRLFSSGAPPTGELYECAACGGADVLRVFEFWNSSRDSDGPDWSESSEVECRACGAFTEARWGATV